MTCIFVRSSERKSRGDQFFDQLASNKRQRYESHDERVKVLINDLDEYHKFISKSYGQPKYDHNEIYKYAKSIGFRVDYKL